MYPIFETMFDILLFFLAQQDSFCHLNSISFLFLNYAQEWVDKSIGMFFRYREREYIFSSPDAVVIYYIDYIKHFGQLSIGVCRSASLYRPST